MSTRRDRRELEQMRAHVRAAQPIMPTTTRLVRVVGLASDAGNARKDADR